MSKHLHPDILNLRSPHTIRKRANLLFDRASQGDSPHFSINLRKMKDCQTYLVKMIREYPDISSIPFHSRWRHFECSNIDRISILRQHPSYPKNSLEEGRVFYELAIISVLLDAGAGAMWQYKEAKTDIIYSRSEGLGIAAFHMYKNSYFNLNKNLSATSDGLRALSLDIMSKGFQITSSNSMSGLSGRVELLKSLAEVISTRQDIFSNKGQLGYFYDYVTQCADQDKNIKANDVFQAVLSVFSPIWPGRISIDNVNLGDVWQFESNKEEELPEFIPFHKLSLWLTYSLLEPLIWHGYNITDLAELTGLAEYRNGGFFIDSGVIVLKDSTMSQMQHNPDSPLIIEWRALTISLLEKLWKDVLEALVLKSDEFPLVKLLEAGTWKAGRELAYKRSKDGEPPIQVISNGTVF